MFEKGALVLFGAKIPLLLVAIAGLIGGAAVLNQAASQRNAAAATIDPLGMRRRDTLAARRDWLSRRRDSLQAPSRSDAPDQSQIWPQLGAGIQTVALPPNAYSPYSSSPAFTPASSPSAPAAPYSPQTGPAWLAPSSAPATFVRALSSPPVAPPG